MKYIGVILLCFIGFTANSQTYYKYLKPEASSYNGFRNYDFASFSSGISLPIGPFAGEPKDLGFHGFADNGWFAKAGMGFQINERFSFSGMVSYSNMPVNQQKLISYVEEITPEKIISANTSNWQITAFYFGPTVAYSEGLYFFLFSGKLGVNGVSSPNIEMIYSDFSSERQMSQNSSIGYGFGYDLEIQMGYRFNEIFGLSLVYNYTQSMAKFENVVYDYNNGINQKIDFEETIQVSNFSLNFIFYFDN